MTKISDKQLKANKRNALKGGVKTTEGKEVIRFNARKHGILSGLVAEYENDFYKQYVDQLFEELQPKTLIENILVERIALHYLKLFRLAKAESEFMKSCLSSTNEFDLLFVNNYKPVVSYLNIQQLANVYGRYETTIENRLYRAMRELKEYKSS
ncbi:hypothetical protein DIZ81_13325 [Legionella taurinensis]|uniref:Sigma-70 family RNA polymerase sigma factor n=1 Tax=Legionella taurinensis TaxID=70611 RepID=A0AB38N1Y5_9GAMM|nr:hypothetical protein [Legionella taurinensis]MDX1836046.1 hypothetical protein [Legionella taurinensis]PUT38750.1 hypothetical protein DB744_13335 [Legionella taurinensis]PUT40129.1 hypothetical protein DB746_12735 [Legionella taurinensis]PUT42281.1 hypothetical protein DB743_13220 [Legionella taurinensis]PUT46052.1 hypothetical protein DB745_12190 [Legionella taurinensis]